MRSTVRTFAVAAAVAGAIVVRTTPANAVEVTVLNRFQRSCYWSCSAYVQTNGAYVGRIGSHCVTKYWWGTRSYTVGPWTRC
jgi:hypothetical protein